MYHGKKLLTIVFTTSVIAVLLFLITGPAKKPEVSKSVSEKTEENFFFRSFVSFFYDPEPRNRAIPIQQESYINEVILEKNSVCVDEDVEVYVEARNPGGQDSSLYYQIGDQAGNPVILRFSDPGQQEINIIVKDYTGTGLESKVVSIDVKECGERPGMTISAQSSADDQEIFDFEIEEIRGLREPCAYTWDFGDGRSLKTTSKRATHDYRKRRQKAYLSTYTVAVSAVSADNKKVTARTSISIPNIHFLSNKMGKPTMPSIYNRFPVVQGDEYSARVEINNIYNENIQLERASVTFRTYNPAREEETITASPGDLVNISRLGANGLTTGIIRINKSLIPPHTGVVKIELAGTLENGKAVTTEIYLDIPPSGKEGSSTGVDKKIEDPELIEKLNKASRIMGPGKPITPGDLEKLEKEGML